MKIKDICKIQSSKRVHENDYCEYGIPFIRGKEITDGSLNNPNTHFDCYISEELFNSIKEQKGAPQKGDILITAVGTIGNVLKVDTDRDFYFKDGNVIWLSEFSSDVYPDFLYYYLKSEFIKTQINRNLIGAVQKALTLDMFGNLSISLPSIEMQKEISSCLRKLDAKLTNNDAIISELESMAKLLYDYWFVQFDFPDENGKPYKSSGGKMVWNEELKRDIPEGWKADRLGCLISKISTGLNPRDNFKFVDKGIDYYTVKNLCVDGHLDNSGCDHIDRSAQSIIHERSNISIGDILYASIAPLGRTYLITDAPENWEINESIFSIRPNTDKTTSVFLQMYLKSEYLIKLFEQCSVGSIFKGVRIDMLQNSVVLIPSFSIVKKFTNQIKDIVLMQHNKWKENAELTSLRDFLLPLLMNGQVKIGDVSD